MFSASCQVLRRGREGLARRKVDIHIIGRVSGGLQPRTVVCNANCSSHKVRQPLTKLMRSTSRRNLNVLGLRRKNKGSSRWAPASLMRVLISRSLRSAQNLRSSSLAGLTLSRKRLILNSSTCPKVGPGSRQWWKYFSQTQLPCSRQRPRAHSNQARAGSRFPG